MSTIFDLLARYSATGDPWGTKPRILLLSCSYLAK